MIHECLGDDSDRLSAWECEFLDSINKQPRLSDRQREILQRIWDKLFG